VFEWYSSVKTFLDINIFGFAENPSGKLAMPAVFLPSAMTLG
jgi:hypothetical protein